MGAAAEEKETPLQANEFRIRVVRGRGERQSTLDEIAVEDGTTIRASCEFKGRTLTYLGNHHLLYPPTAKQGRRY